MKKIFIFLLLCFIAAASAAGCGGNQDKSGNDKSKGGTKPTASYTDGTYRAEFDRYDPRNWIPYVEITIKDGKITKAYYDYTNEAGDKRTEDKAYMEAFSAVSNGMTPREAFDKLGRELVDTQDIGKVDAVSGATHSSRNFTKLVPAALVKAAAGGTEKARIRMYIDGIYKIGRAHV